MAALPVDAKEHHRTYLPQMLIWTVNWSTVSLASNLESSNFFPAWYGFSLNLEELHQKSENVLQKILNCFTNCEKLLLNYLMIILQLWLRLNTKNIHGKRIPSMSACVACGHVAKVSDSKVSDHSNLKILSSK